MDYIGIGIFMSMVFYLDYKIYLRGGKSFIFKDKTQLDKDLREIQKLEVAQKLRKLKKLEKDIEQRN